MKQKFFITVLFIVGAFFTGCHKDSLKSSDNLNNSIQSTNFKSAKNEFNTQEYNQLLATNQARLEELGVAASRDCIETATVPDDYATIQEAIDAVCAYGDVIVKEGTYNETVLVYKPGLHIKANGEVLLNGGFRLIDGADDVKIHKFTVDNTTSSILYGIQGADVTGCEVKQNTVYGSGVGGIRFIHSSNISVVRNNVGHNISYHQTF